MVNVYIIFVKTSPNGITDTYVYHYFAIGTLRAGKILPLPPKDEHVLIPGYEYVTLNGERDSAKISQM